MQRKWRRWRRRRHNVGGAWIREGGGDDRNVGRGRRIVEEEAGGSGMEEWRGIGEEEEALSGGEEWRKEEEEVKIVCVGGGTKGAD